MRIHPHTSSALRCHLSRLPTIRQALNPLTSNHSPCNNFTTTTNFSKKGNPQLPPRPTLPDADLKHVYLKGSGPGGQKINKTSSAVQLTHLPTGIVVKSQATRSQKQNHNIARKILAEKIELMEKGGESRVAKKIEWQVRKKSSADKKKRRKYRKLAEGKEEEDGEDGVEDVDGAEDRVQAVGEVHAAKGEDAGLAEKS